ncbi:MAG: outer membrane protein assembly factor BamD [Candidatus Lambdaproteobacteria bacterium]|nr:outer membrane protein assembly factor BamD [Candidatus Lambdaproteobacteria bacterium]
MRPFSPRRPVRLLVLALVSLATAGCEGANPVEVQVPARRLYFEGELLAAQGLYSDAVTKFQQAADQNRGTRLGGYAYLWLAQLYEKQEKWIEAETQYRLFLTTNAQSHLTSWVLYRLLSVNYQKSFTGLIYPDREVDRDTEPNRQLILEYKRFYLLYPNSVYLPETVPLYRGARITLARHELVVGDFYMRRGLYNAAAGRYLYLLLNYPEFDDTEGVLKKLIAAYRANQQPLLAAEMARIHQQRSPGAAGPATAGSPPESPPEPSRAPAGELPPAPGGPAREPPREPPPGSTAQASAPAAPAAPDAAARP